MPQHPSRNVLFWIIAGLILLVGAFYIARHTNTPTQNPLHTGISTSTLSTQYALNEYTDPTYGFSFWYPNTLRITVQGTSDKNNFPGGVAVETIQIGSVGNTSITVVDSPGSTITDEPSNHASPIGQTKYFYDATTETWMVAFPDSRLEGTVVATTSADVSKTTVSGLVLLPSGKRFNTSIIPLSTTRFLVVSDGGGSSFTSQLAQTIAQVGVTISPSTQEPVLQAEAAAYKESQTYYKDMLVCTDVNDCPLGYSCERPGPIPAGAQTPEVCVPSNQTIPL